MKKTIDRRKQSFMIVLIVSLLTANMMTVYAGYNEWLAPFENLVDSMVSFMALIGKALLGWALFEIATALFSHDTSQMPQAMRRVGGGTLLIFIRIIIEAMSTASVGGGTPTTTAPPPPETVQQTAMAIMDFISRI